MILRDLVNYYLPFDTSDMMNMFSGVNFSSFSDFELFISTLVFNITFIIFIFLVIYVFLKCIYKVCSWLF